MLNFKFLKNTVLILLSLISIFFAYLLFVSYKNTPVIENIGNITIEEFISEQSLISDENYVAGRCRPRGCACHAPWHSDAGWLQGLQDVGVVGS